MKSILQIIKHGNCQQIKCEDCYFYAVKSEFICAVQEINTLSTDNIVVQNAKFALREEKLKRILK